MPIRFPAGSRNVATTSRAPWSTGFTISPPRRDDSVNRRGRARNHDVNHQSGVGRHRPPEDPRATDLIDGIVECCRTITSLSNLPAEGTVVELGRLLDIRRGDLDVADLAGSVGGWRCLGGHRVLWES